VSMMAAGRDRPRVMVTCADKCDLVHDQGELGQDFADLQICHTRGQSAELTADVSTEASRLGVEGVDVRGAAGQPSRYSAWLCPRKPCHPDRCLGWRRNRSSIPKPIAPTSLPATRPGGWGHGTTDRIRTYKCSLGSMIERKLRELSNDQTGLPKLTK